MLPVTCTPITLFGQLEQTLQLYMMKLFCVYARLFVSNLRAEIELNLSREFHPIQAKAEPGRKILCCDIVMQIIF